VLLINNNVASCRHHSFGFFLRSSAWVPRQRSGSFRLLRLGCGFCWTLPESAELSPLSSLLVTGVSGLIICWFQVQILVGPPRSSGINTTSQKLYAALAFLQHFVTTSPPLRPTVAHDQWIGKVNSRPMASDSTECPTMLPLLSSTAIMARKARDLFSRDPCKRALRGTQVEVDALV
jgi:hypothetical protein